MSIWNHLAVKALSVLLLLSCGWGSATAADPSQYILVNLHRHEMTREGLSDIKQKLSASTNGEIRIGVSMIYSYLQIPAGDSDAESRFLRQLRDDLDLVAEMELPILVQLDGEQWWNARPDLWNWWDASKPGYDPKNAENVEWTDWSPEHAVKIAWRNWGRQLRVLPPPNLMSPKYVAAWEEKMEKIVPVILDWEKSLPENKKHLFVGLKVGWESSVGVNAWHYPNGNDLLDKPEKDDPQTGLDGKRLPGRGVQTIGYAAVKTAGIRDHGQITEADLAEVARRHLENLAKKAAELGVPRERLFTHGAAWKAEELLYDAPVNKYSCPGWSFYDHAPDLRQDQGVQRALASSDAPYWAATEWLLFHDDQAKWTSALENALSSRRCRYLCIFNWSSIKSKNTVHNAIRNVVAEK